MSVLGGSEEFVIHTFDPGIDLRCPVALDTFLGGLDLTRPIVFMPYGYLEWEA